MGRPSLRAEHKPDNERHCEGNPGYFPEQGAPGPGDRRSALGTVRFQSAPGFPADITFHVNERPILRALRSKMLGQAPAEESPCDPVIRRGKVSLSQRVCQASCGSLSLPFCFFTDQHADWDTLSAVPTH